ncbi:MAG: YHS domain-containing protein [Fimbriimonadaceae bacterium]
MQAVVMRNEVDPADAAGSHEYKGTTYQFCSKSCLEKFRGDPENWCRPHFRAVPQSIRFVKNKEPNC